MLIPQQQPGGLIPQPPQQRGLGLLPLIVGGIGAALGGSQFSVPFMGGLRAGQFDQRQAYQDQLRNWQFQQQQQRYSRQDALAEEKMRLAEAEREREARERSAKISATVEALVAQGTPRDQAERLAVAGVGGDVLTARPSSIQELLDLPPEDLARYTELQRAMRPGTTIQMPQIITGPGGQKLAAVPDPSAPGGVRTTEIIPGTGTPEERKEAAEARAKARAEGEVAELLTEYENIRDEASGFGMVVGPTLRDRADRLRWAIATRLARADEPTGKLTDADITNKLQMVPDPFGPMDAVTFGPAITQLRELYGGGASQQGAPEQGAPLPPDATDEEIDAKYLGNPGG